MADSYSSNGGNAAAPHSANDASTTPTHPPPLVTSGPAAPDLTSNSARTPTSAATSPTGRLRSASIKLLQADAPLGMWAATGSVVSQAPTIGDIRRGSFHHEDGWNQERVLELHRSRSSTTSGGSRISRRTSGLGAGRREKTGTNLESEGVIHEHVTAEQTEQHAAEKGREKNDVQSTESAATATGVSNGYSPPPKLPWQLSTKIALISFWKWFLTPFGFLFTLYGLNVVAWGGMLFLLLCNASPAMCHPTCNDINSPRRIWIEIDSQILNALFCVTGFGLIPWRFRDLYWLLVYRGVFARDKAKRVKGLRMLAGIHRGWFRLPNSQNWQAEGDSLEDEHSPSVPLPLEKKLEPPLTGERAPATSMWRMDFVIWMNVWNTFFQACLCGFMWGMNRHNRPSWSTGFFIAVAMIVAACGGIMIAVEGKKVKKVEGIPPRPAAALKIIERAVVKDPHLLERRQSPATEQAANTPKPEI